MIEDGVWIGGKVTILPGVHIGTNALVAKYILANCVVTGSFIKINFSFLIFLYVLLEELESVNVSICCTSQVII
jgi:hypothetical protein